VAQRLVDVGQNIVANNPVIRFQNVVDIVADVPEAYVAYNLRSTSTRQSVAELSIAPGRQFPVYVKEVAQIADPKTHVFEVRFALKAPPGIRALPGMTANVTISTQQAQSRATSFLLLSQPSSSRTRESRWRGLQAPIRRSIAEW
jgi:membrane fusion protein, multidrug efflux system